MKGSRHEGDNGEDDCLDIGYAVKNRQQDAGLAKRTSANPPNKKLGHELHRNLPEWKNAIAESHTAEWRPWTAYDPVELLMDAKLNNISKSDIIILRVVRTDKNAATRRDRDFAEHPLIAKIRGAPRVQRLSTASQSPARRLPAGTRRLRLYLPYPALSSCGSRHAPLCTPLRPACSPMGFLEHRGTIMSLPGAEPFKLCPTLCLCLRWQGIPCRDDWDPC